MQRITRYTLLLKQIKRYTPERTREFYDLDEALFALENLLNRINEQTRQIDNQRLLKALYSHLHADDVTLPFYSC